MKAIARKTARCYGVQPDADAEITVTSGAYKNRRWCPATNWPPRTRVGVGAEVEVEVCWCW